MRNLVGLSTLALLLAMVSRLAMGESERIVTGLLAFAVASPIAWFAWHDSKSPQGPAGWFLMALGSIGMGGIFVLIDGLVGLGKNADASFWRAAQSVGSPFGFVLTVFVCPVFTCICISGAARAAYARWKSGR